MIKRMVDAATKQPVTGAEACGRLDREEQNMMTRRALIKAAPAAVVAGLPALTLEKYPDAELLALGEPYEQTFATIKTLGSAYARAEEQFFAQRRASHLDEHALRMMTGVDRAEDAYHRALDRGDLVIDRIVDTPARTIRGVSFKAMVSRRECNSLPDLIESIVADLIAMGSHEA